MRFRWLAFGGAVWMVAAGCSASDPVVPSATVQTEIPLGQREVTTTRAPETTVVVTSVVSTSVVTETVAPTTRLRPAVVGPSPSDLEALFAATLLADQVQYEQFYLMPAQRSPARLLEVLTPNFANTMLASFVTIDATGNRYEKGTIDDRLVLRMENYSAESDTADVILCRRNNASQFDTNGTPQVDDDKLIQSNIESGGFRAQMSKVDGQWKRNSVKREIGEKCESLF